MKLKFIISTLLSIFFILSTSVEIASAEKIDPNLQASMNSARVAKALVRNTTTYAMQNMGESANKTLPSNLFSVFSQIVKPSGTKMYINDSHSVVTIVSKIKGSKNQICKVVISGNKPVIVGTTTYGYDCKSNS